MNHHCLFCQLVETKTPFYQDAQVFVLNDINPQAPVHQLIIPRMHIQSMQELVERNEFLIMECLLKIAVNQAKKKKLTGYRLVTNIGLEGGQSVMHLHMHLIGGKQLKRIH